MKGHSGHAAMPHLARDPMVASAHLLLALQTIVSRNVDPLDSAVITMATMEAGSAANQIPGEAVMRGTMRTLRNAVCDQVEERSAASPPAWRRACDVDDRRGRCVRGNPVTQNSPAERDLAAEAVTAAGLPLRRDMLPAMTGEDFAWYLAGAAGGVRVDRQRRGGGWLRAAQFQLRFQRCDPAGRGGVSGQRGEAGAGFLTPRRAPCHCEERRDEAIPSPMRRNAAYPGGGLLRRFAPRNDR